MKLLLSDRQEIAEGTLAVWFRPERSVHFMAGQFGDFTLVDPPYRDEKGNTRTFSFANSPNNDLILVATRMRDSAFKRSLATLSIGAPVQLNGPMGTFTLHKDTGRPAVFLTGGIGITPVRSIVEQAAQNGTPQRIFVFYSNRTLDRIAFLDDFRTWTHTNENIRFIPTLTREAPEGWKYEFGKIDQRMLSRHVSDLHAPIYYIVGPPTLVDAMKSVLGNIGLHELQIKSEEFVGY